MKTFWTQWRREYLLNLREFHRQSLKGPLARKDSSIKIGDVVLIQENLPRSRWRLALVEKLIEGRDGCCRAAQVKLANGNRIQRPLQLLFPLEVQDTESDHKESKSEDINMTRDSQRPSKRKAAIEARQKLHMWTQWQLRFKSST
ncbi:uncharacterized protein LOC122962128 [Acropora millepora]|uniref:uncharacterized protein LOC122962128 n=1 Tax=Acropora millepora TaxID=45264 RepID=UPI001CF37CE1|nr:uncharacterized protein LOC122962128 [Acropora millepora]